MTCQNREAEKISALVRSQLSEQEHLSSITRKRKETQQLSIKGVDFGSPSCNLEDATAFPFKSYSHKCGFDNEIPQIFWEDVPEGTSSFALTLVDKTSTQCLMSIWDVSPETREINATPQELGSTKEDKNMYEGPCHPSDMDNPIHWLLRPIITKLSPAALKSHCMH
eukprot:Filipodium_phascolosomae@DN2522_c0_g1_i3.p1